MISDAVGEPTREEEVGVAALELIAILSGTNSSIMTLLTEQGKKLKLLEGRFKKLAAQAKKREEATQKKAEKAKVTKAERAEKKKLNPRKLSAYNVFAKEQLPRIHSSQPGLPQPEVMVEAGKIWKTLSAEQKQPYIIQAETMNKKAIADLAAAAAANGSSSSSSIANSKGPLQYVKPPVNDDDDEEDEEDDEDEDDDDDDEEEEVQPKVWGSVGSAPAPKPSAPVHKLVSAPPVVAKPVAPLKEKKEKKEKREKREEEEPKEEEVPAPKKKAKKDRQ